MARPCLATATILLSHVPVSSLQCNTKLKAVQYSATQKHTTVHRTVYSTPMCLKVWSPYCWYCLYFVYIIVDIVYHLPIESEKVEKNNPRNGCWGRPKDFCLWNQINCPLYSFTLLYTPLLSSSSSSSFLCWLYFKLFCHHLHHLHNISKIFTNTFHWCSDIFLTQTSQSTLLRSISMLWSSTLLSWQGR